MRVLRVLGLVLWMFLVLTVVAVYAYVVALVVAAWITPDSPLAAGLAPALAG